MSIGIDFILKASTASFTKGLATIDNATSKLQKSLTNKFDGRDLARGLTTALGLSVDKIADKFARLWTSMTKQAEEAYNKLGTLTDELTSKTIEAGRARLTDEQRYQLVLQDTGRLQRAIADNLGKTVEDQVKLTQDKIDLLAKEKEALEINAKIQKDAEEKSEAREKNRQKIAEDVAKAKAEIKKEDEDFRKDQSDKYNKAEDDLRQKFAPTVEQLAAMGTGGFTAVDDPRLIARQILEKEKHAAEAGGRGDISGALNLGREARGMRESLQFTTGGGQALTAQTAEVALRNALDQTNKELVEVREALAGIIKAQ